MTGESRELTIGGLFSRAIQAGKLNRGWGTEVFSLNDAELSGYLLRLKSGGERSVPQNAELTLHSSPYGNHNFGQKILTLGTKLSIVLRSGDCVVDIYAKQRDALINSGAERVEAMQQAYSSTLTRLAELPLASYGKIASDMSYLTAIGREHDEQGINIALAGDKINIFDTLPDTRSRSPQNDNFYSLYHSLTRFPQLDAFLIKDKKHLEPLKFEIGKKLDEALKLSSGEPAPIPSARIESQQSGITTAMSVTALKEFLRRTEQERGFTPLI